MAAWLAVLQTNAVLVDALEKDLEASHGLPITWFEVLIKLDDAPGGRVRMQDLVEAALLTKSGVTRLVDRMQAAGLVQRCACDSDRRVTYAEITETGRKAIRDAMPSHKTDVEREFARHLSVDEQRVLRQLLTKVLQAHGRALDTSCGAGERPAGAETA